MNTNQDYYTHTLEQQAHNYLRKLTQTVKKYRTMKLRSLARHVHVIKYLQFQ